MRYRVLGEVEVLDADSGAQQIGGPNQRLVLAALLAHPNEVVSTHALLDALWDDDPPASAVPTLRTYVSRLRRVVGADLVTDGTGYRLDVDQSELDATLFERCLDEAATAAPAVRLDLLDTALGMWRGAAFGRHADIPLVVGAARRLESLRVDALEARVAALLASGAASKAVADATALVADHPRRESLWTTLIDALVAVDRSADATQAAADARAALAEAGLEPGPGLRAAEARALGIAAAPSPTPATTSDEARSPPRPDDTGARRGVPVGTLITPSGRPSTFVGRERQLDELAELLDDAPIVTLVGPGGVGKTRLAVELAARVAPGHRLGARIIELGALTDPDEVPGAVASGLGLTSDRSSSDEALVNAGDLDVVVVVDNAEHVLAAAARVVELITSGGGSARVIVTSRQRLAVDGEHVRAVRPLAVETSTSSAQALLRDRAAAAGATLGEHDDAITRVVRRLDGLPLAIEMAAAQLTSCTLAELLAAVDDRLDELHAPSDRVPPRHRSLGALIDWSLGQLDVVDSRLLHRLTVFAGAFTADDIAGVLGGDAVAATRRLADRSLVVAAVHSDRTSFRVLFVMRERIHHRLGPVPDEVRAAHARWYLSRARSAVIDLMSARERAGRDRLDEILDQLRAAHRWASDHDRPTALALSAAIHPFAQSSLNDELLAWADRLVPDGPQPGDDPDDVAIVMASAATRVSHRGEHARGAELARRALAVAEHPEARLPALETLADATLSDGSLDDSDTAYQALLDDGDATGNAWYGGSGATGMLLVAAYAGRPPARPIDPDAFGGDAPPSARAWLAYGRAELGAADDPAGAEAHYREALALARSVDNRFIEGVTLASLAAHQARTGAHDAALATFRAAIEHWLDAADHSHLITTLRNLAVLLRALDMPVETAQLVGGLTATHVATYGSGLADLADIERWLDATLEPAALGDARATGLGLSPFDLARWSLATIDQATDRHP